MKSIGWEGKEENGGRRCAKGEFRRKSVRKVRRAREKRVDYLELVMLVSGCEPKVEGMEGRGGEEEVYECNPHMDRSVR